MVTLMHSLVDETTLPWQRDFLTALIAVKRLDTAVLFLGDTVRGDSFFFSPASGRH
jgi:hypothetical protein